ncbi:MAG: aminotransferase class V-fold PLP-dependent enzyme [Clostridiales bacterium]|nr:aminotransferase class V-fold PLP-dependent enzyme [Clostridiales bacterium]
MDIYLDNAATSHPKPDTVVEAVRRALTEMNGNPGRSGHRRALEGGHAVLACRDALSELINAPDPDEVTFCFNCTDALNLAIKGSLHRGDHVVASALEHNSVLRVLHGLQATGQIELTLVEPLPDGAVSPEQYSAAVRRNTALAVLTHASNVTGAVQPVAAVGQAMRQLGVRYLVDGAQALGVLPVDVRALSCDLYAFPGHKALLGPQGTGALYAAGGLWLNTLREGGTGSSSDSVLQPPERPERFESGTVNLPGIAGLREGVKQVALHRAEYMAKERELTDALIRGLMALPGVTVYGPVDPAGRVGVVSFNVGDLSSSQVSDWLDRAGIAVRSGLHCAPLAHRGLGTLRRGAVRASLGWASTQGDVDALLAAVAAILAGQPPPDEPA